MRVTQTERIGQLVMAKDRDGNDPLPSSLAKAKIALAKSATASQDGLVGPRRRERTRGEGRDEMEMDLVGGG